MLTEEELLKLKKKTEEAKKDIQKEKAHIEYLEETLKEKGFKNEKQALKRIEEIDERIEDIQNEYDELIQEIEDEISENE